MDRCCTIVKILGYEIPYSSAVLYFIISYITGDKEEMGTCSVGSSNTDTR